MKKNNHGVKITSVVVSAIIAITSISYTLNKKESNDITTTIITSTGANQIDDKYNNNISIEDILETKFETYSYEELVDKLQCSSKKFDRQTQKYLENLVQIVYKNGTNLDGILNQIFNFEVSNFIMENIIKPLDEIKNIEIVSYDDYDRLSELDYRTYYDSEKDKIVICNESEIFNYQRLLEELMHVNQTDILSTSEDGKEFDYADYCIFGEGEANVISWPLAYGTICNDSVCVMYSDENYSDESIIFGTGYSYSAATKYYMYLTTLLGKDIMNEAKSSHDVSVITNALKEMYGISSGDFYDKMKDVVVDLMNNIDNKRTHMLAPIENIYFKCLEQKLERIDNQKELIEFFNMYRYINIQYGFIYNEFDENSNIIDKTDVVIDQSIENKLFEKLEEYSVLSSLSSDVETRKKIFDSVINPVKYDGNNIYPVSLESVSILYDEELHSVLLSYNGDTIVTSVDTKEYKIIKNQSLNSGFSIFDLYDEKII